jgi:hypothetical protein
LGHALLEVQGFDDLPGWEEDRIPKGAQGVMRRAGVRSLSGPLPPHFVMLVQD